MYCPAMTTHGYAASSMSQPLSGVAQFVSKETGYATMVLDRHGRIVSCGDAAARILGERASRLNGQNAADFILGLSLGGTSARYRSGYLDYLAVHSNWREFVVSDSEGASQVAWFKLSPVVAEDQRLFLLAMRIMGDGGLPVATPARPGAET